MDKARVFIASTFEGLEEIRRAIYKFVEDYGFEPLMWEAGSVPHNPQRAQSTGIVGSAFQAAGDADILIVIVSKRYGHVPDSTDGRSATEIEYDSARQMDIPAYVFVEVSIFDEYRRFYLKNAQNDTLSLEADTRVHKFIAKIEGAQKEIGSGAPLILTFQTAEEIIRHLRNQWGFLFGTYLRDKRKCAACSGRFLRQIESRVQEGQGKIQGNRLITFTRDAAREIRGISLDPKVILQCVARSSDLKSFCQEVSATIGCDFRIDRSLQPEAAQEYQKAKGLLGPSLEGE